MSADEPSEERTIGDWTSYQDDEGRTYYYNNVTEESSWDPPSGFDDDLTNNEGGAPAEEEVQTSTPPDHDGITASPSMNIGDSDGISKSPTFDEQPREGDDVADGEEIGGEWIAYKDDEGRTYYYNSETGETQWDRPDIASKTEAVVSMKEDDGDYIDPSPTASDREDEEEAHIETTIVTDEQKDDPATIAENFLKGPDAVMEPQVLDHISTLVTEIGPQQAGKKAMQSLMNGYRGDTAMCGLMAFWLAELKASNAMHSKSTARPAPPAAVKEDESLNEKRFNRGADAARDVVEQVVNRLAKERFTKAGGDAIMKLSKKQVAFVDAMIESERWRNLLIDLSATNTDTKLFMYCLQSISNKGHHRAIANRINQSDYFGVLNSMLSAELSLLGKIAVDGYSKEVSESIDTSKGRMGTLVTDLRRTCSSTSYTYLYSNELLHELISQAEAQSSRGSDSSALKQAAKKWRRLQEELEDEMLKAQTTGTTFQKKRRVDVTLSMNELVQRQRRRLNPNEIVSGSALNGNDSSKTALENSLDSSIASFLTKCSLGNPVDKESVECIFRYAYGGSTDRIGDLLILHPLAITYVLRNMFGTKRIRQLETRQKCARLVALAVIASERNVFAENMIKSAVSDEDQLCQILLKGSQLCEQVEAMVSFTVLDRIEGSNGSVGRQLSAMCIKHAVVAEGALLWAKELASGPDFVTTAAYPTLSPCILSLARLICIHHPTARPAVLEVTLIFMSHSNREISHQKMQSIKEQCLRLMIWLSAQGMVLGVISAIRERLQKGSSELDSALVRYFMSGLLEVIQPPFSLPFARALSGMLMERPCIDTLTSQLFDATKKSELSQLIDQFEKVFAADGAMTLEGDDKLVSTLKSAYV